MKMTLCSIRRSTIYVGYIDLYIMKYDLHKLEEET